VPVRRQHRIGEIGYEIPMPADLTTRLTDLDRSLAEFDASTTAPATVGQVFNALLEEAKRAHGTDPIVAAIEPVRFTSAESEFAEINVGALRGLIQQLVDADD
jgi:hypothetical protein